MRYLLTALVLTSTVACGGNNYGYAPEYAPLDDEEAYFEKGKAHSYEEVRRNPSAYAGETLAWFGVVNDVQQKGNGQVQVAMTLHFHQDRHLCADQFDSSCRVTISEKEGGPFSALLTLRPEDREGKDRVYAGSLLKIYGPPLPEYDDEGGPIVNTKYYRHWPRGTYVTTGRAGNMRR